MISSLFEVGHLDKHFIQDIRVLFVYPPEKQLAIKYRDLLSFCFPAGVEVFWLCIGILLTAYASALVIGASSSFLLSKLVTVIGHCTLASILWYRANSVNLEDNASVTTFYMSIWKEHLKQSDLSFVFRLQVREARDLDEDKGECSHHLKMLINSANKAMNQLTN